MKSQSDEETGVDSGNDNDKPVCSSEDKEKPEDSPQHCLGSAGAGYPRGWGGEKLDLNVEDELIS